MCKYVYTQHKKLLTNSISAKPVQHTTLSDGLKRGSTQHTVHTLLQEVPVAELLSHVHGQLLQLSVIGVGHAGETHTKPARGRCRDDWKVERGSRLEETWG